MHPENPCSICGKLCSCKKLGGVCKDCKGNQKWTNLYRCDAKKSHREKLKKVGDAGG